MPTTGDLINLDTLVLTDTFNTWLNRTNQIVDKINPLQVYDVDVGAGTTAIGSGAGLAKYTGISSGNYNGIVTIGLNPGPGLHYESISGQSRSTIDFRHFAEYGRVLYGTGTSASTDRVASSDEIIINDISDTTSSSSGTAKKIQARYMLPPEVAMDLLTISGDVIIRGNLSTYGANSFISNNNLNIEDKQINIGYQQAVVLGLTGVTGGSFPTSGGQTTYYFTTVSGLTAEFYGHLQSYTGSAAGPTATMYLGSLFTVGHFATDVGATGYVSLSSTGSTRYLFNTNYGVTSAYLTNVNLDEGGIVLKGSQGDKSLLWIWTDNDSGDYYDSWQTNTNIGVDGSTYGIISRVYRSYGYTGTDNTKSQFIFTAESGKNAEIYLAETSTQTVPLTFTGGSWRVSRDRTTNNLVFSVGATGISALSTSFYVTPGASGTTFAGVTVNNFASGLNVDLHDGAHASTAAAAYTIPIADQYGRVDGNFLNADAVRRRYTQTSHGLTFGMAVRFDVAGGWTSAVATTPELGEALGIVSAVHSANEFTVTHQGRIDGISGGSMTLEGIGFTAGNVYFLGASASNRGKLIYDPDYNTSTRIAIGQIRKPMLLALSATQGYVMNSMGTKTPTVTDQVYLYGLVPIGSIYAYAGSLTTLSDEWLLCDGDRYRAIDYPELYNTIGQTYEGRITFSASGTTGTMVGGTRNIQPNDVFTITPIGSATSYTATVATSGVNSTTGVLTFTTPIACGAGTHRIVPSINSANERIFFVPDMRTRVAIGGSTGSSQYTSVGLSAYTAGNFGGNELLTIGTTNLPPHVHTLNTSRGLLASGSTRFVTESAPTQTIDTGSTGSGTPIDAHTPYLVTHYIIRAKANTGATILTGHNHDGRYHLLNDNMVITSVGNYRGNPSVAGFTGFNVVANSSLLGRTAYIMSCFVPNSAYTGNLQIDSRTKTNIIGDLTVWGTGLTSMGGWTGVHRPMFTLSTHGAALTIEGGTGGMPDPMISFYTDGAGYKGGIQGLGAPQGDTWAVNKYYSDTSDKILKANYNGGYPSTYGVTGFNIVADRSILGITAYAMQVFAVNNPNTSNGDSHLQTYVYGDLTVWGDGLSTGSYTGHADSVFTVDPLRSQVTIEGKTARQPKLVFQNDDAGAAPIGKISGLTSPVNGDEAANKNYVDDQGRIYWITNVFDDLDQRFNNDPNSFYNDINLSVPGFLVGHESPGGYTTYTSIEATTDAQPTGVTSQKVKQLVWDAGSSFQTNEYATHYRGDSNNYRKYRSYAIKNVLTDQWTRISDSTTAGIETLQFYEYITPGIYNVSVNARLVMPSAKGRKAVMQIEGYRDYRPIWVPGSPGNTAANPLGFTSGSRLSRCRSVFQTNNDGNTNSAGEQMITFNGFARLGPSPNLKLALEVVPSHTGAGNTADFYGYINNVMLTKIANLP